MIIMDKIKLPIEGKLPNGWEIKYYTLMGKFYYWLRMLGGDKRAKTGELQEADVEIIEDIPGGLVLKNTEIRDHLSETPLNSEIFEVTKNGAPLIKLGDGSKPRVMLTAGVHGNELPPQIAALNLVNDLNGKGLNGTVYVVPFTAPQASAQNSKLHENDNLNLVADVPGTPTNTIINVAQGLKINALADFHATSTHPAENSVIYFLDIRSSKMAVYINKKTNSRLLAHIYNQGTLITAASNQDIPTILCEVESPDGLATESSIQDAYHQMKTFLEFHRVI
ncbi:MAG: Succinylglutamate desuccinylase / Aspartoacylase family protein [Methanobacterium sp. PtaU1.Bin097]|nr:MAG: Succinylglutamate desuccinylase / Aspartoacylase family protein [Methanobacterium sp. PtaU1.Bin097]